MEDKLVLWPVGSLERLGCIEDVLRCAVADHRRGFAEGLGDLPAEGSGVVGGERLSVTPPDGRALHHARGSFVGLLRHGGHRARFWFTPMT